MVSVRQSVPARLHRVLGASRHVAWYVGWQTGGSGARERGVAPAAPARSTRRAKRDRIHGRRSARETGRVDAG